MEIQNLRIVNDTLSTAEGDLVAPTTYYMDVAANELDTFAVPISEDTYTALHELIEGSGSGAPEGVGIV